MGFMKQWNRKLRSRYFYPIEKIGFRYLGIDPTIVSPQAPLDESERDHPSAIVLKSPIQLFCFPEEIKSLKNSLKSPITFSSCTGS